MNDDHEREKGRSWKDIEGHGIPARACLYWIRDHEKHVFRMVFVLFSSSSILFANIWQDD